MLKLPECERLDVIISFSNEARSHFNNFKAKRYQMIRSAVLKQRKAWARFNTIHKANNAEPTVIDRSRAMNLSRELRIIADLSFLAEFLTIIAPDQKIFNENIIPMLNDFGGFEKSSVLYPHFDKLCCNSLKLKALNPILLEVNKQHKLLIMTDFIIVAAVIRQISNSIRIQFS